MYDVLLLRPLVSPAQEENHHLAKPGAVHPITRSPIDPKFYHSATNRLAISEVAKGEPVEANPNPHARLLVSQVLQPLREGLLAFGALVVSDFNDWGHCNL
jgi:hypothetical protein